MTKFSRGDVVLVNFIFTDESDAKRRPALVISTDTYHTGRDEAIIAAITSRSNRILFGDRLVTDWRGAGLLFPSVITAVIRTVKQEMIAQKLGTMPPPDMMAVDEKLRAVVGI